VIEPPFLVFHTTAHVRSAMNLTIYPAKQEQSRCTVEAGLHCPQPEKSTSVGEGFAWQAKYEKNSKKCGKIKTKRVF
jgi:hypothetical protein